LPKRLLISVLVYNNATPKPQAFEGIVSGFKLTCGSISNRC
jgi:hypothetical protein